MSSRTTAARIALALALTVVVVMIAPAVGADDRYADLVVGVPFENGVGAVAWLWGAAGGLTDTGNGLQLGPSYGWSEVLASGDFDGDFAAELVVGNVRATVMAANWAGTVSVCSRAPAPIRGAEAGAAIWWNCSVVDQSMVGDAPEHYDEFGAALAVGDFDRDGYQDLAIGAVAEDVATSSDAGMVHVLFGTPFGLSAVGHQVLAQGAGGIAEAAEGGDRFGTALAAGDFDGDGHDDLAIGVPGEDGCGAVHVVYGSAGGLRTDTDALFLEGFLVGSGECELGDGFGSALAAGDFDGDGCDDLAIGAPDEDLSGTDEGRVTVVRGSATGLPSSAPGVSWEQGDIATTWSGNRFGRRLAAGDFDGDGHHDLVIGVPDSAVYPGITDPEEGVAYVMYGGAGGLTTAGATVLAQGLLVGAGEAGDRFGESLATGDLDADGFDDLAIGAPGEAVGILAGAGAVNVVYGSGEGLVVTGNQMWHQDALTVQDACEFDDAYGAAVVVLRSRGIFRDGFDIGSTGTWSTAAP